MAFRVDSCVVYIDGVIEFEGRQHIFVMLPADDPLVAQILDRNNAINLAAAKSSEVTGIL
jgi:hypothetical protein